jgi:hypothetical protein
MYTILGYYEDNKQPWATSVDAMDAEIAEERGRRQMIQSYVDGFDGFPEEDEFDTEAEYEAAYQEVLDENRGQVVTVGVVEGEHTVTGGDNENGI